MLSVIIATHESERTLVPTLTALVPGMTASLLREVVIADAASTDATAEVADLAGCGFMSSEEPIGARLKAAAAATTAPWLMFLRAGCVPEPGWIGAIEHFMQQSERLAETQRAAAFRPQSGPGPVRPGLAEVLGTLRLAFAGRAAPAQGLLIARRFYDALGGHPEHDQAEAALLRKLGRRRIVLLSCAARAPS